MIQQSGRLAFLDALRGVAAVEVVFVHLWWVGESTVFHLSAGLAREVYFGSTGVLLFFVISGFSLDMTMAKHLRRQAPMINYGLSRFFRIAPMFYLMIPVSVARDLALSGRLAYGPLSLLLNLAFLFNLAPGHQFSIVRAGWTIGVEMAFYALFPLLFRWPAWVSAIVALFPYAVIALVLHPTRFGTFSWCLFPGFLPLFLLGMATHRAYVRLRGRPRPWAGRLIWGSVAALLLCSLAPNAWGDIFMRLPIGLAYAGLVLGAALAPPRVLVNPGWRLYGKLSYSIYLIHLPVLMAFAGPFRAWLAVLPPLPAYLVALPLTFAVLTPLGWLAWRLVERPFDELRRGLVSRLEGWDRGASIRRLELRTQG